MNERILQALVRFGRIIGGAVISAALLGLADFVGALELDPTMAVLVVTIGTALLNALGKALRGPDVPVDTYTAERVRGFDRTTRRDRSLAFFLPF